MQSNDFVADDIVSRCEFSWEDHGRLEIVFDE